MKTLHSPAARRLLALAHPSGPVQHFADGGPVGFGARGLSGLRDLIPKMQAMGYQQAAPAAAPAPAPAEASGAARLYAMIPKIEAMGYKQHRMADGGPVRGPGTGTSDSINAKLSDGEFVMPADTVRKVGVRRLQDLVDMTHTPTAKVGHPAQYADGGLVRRRPGFDADTWAQQQEQERAASTQASLAAGQAAMNQAQAEADAAAKRAPSTAPAAPAGQSLDQRVAQIPTGGLKAPPADGSQNSWANTETGRNLSNIASALPGSLGGAIPAVAKTGGAISGGIDAATRLLNAGAGAGAISALPGAASAQSAPASPAGAGRGMVNPPTVNPSAPLPSAPAAAPPVSDPSTTSPATTSDVTRVGNSYSGTNVAGDITVNGRAPGGGFMGGGGSAIGMTPEAAQRAGLITNSTPVGYNPAYDTRLTGQSAQERLMAAGTGQAPTAQNNTAAENLAGRQQQDARSRLMALASGGGQTPGVQAPIVRNSSNDWQSRNDLRNLEVSAKSITNRPEWSGAGMGRFRGQGGPSVDVAAYQSAFENDRALRALQPVVDQAAMRENAGLQREGMQQAGETDRTNIRAQGVADANQIARGRLSLEQIAAGYSNRSADRIDRAQAALENATTPEGQKSARARLMALAGKADDDLWAYSPGGQTVDPRTGMAITQPGVIFNKRTGETRADGGQQATQRVTSQAQFDALPKGATYTGADGRTYRKP